MLLAHRAIERLHVEQTVDPPADVRLGPWLGVCRPGAGHTDDGMVVSLPDEHLLVVGDYLSSLEIPAAHASVQDYRATLQMLIGVIERERPQYVVVGHGRPHTSEQALRIADEDLDYIEAVLRYRRRRAARPTTPSRSPSRSGPQARPTGPCTRRTSPAPARRPAPSQLRVEPPPRLPITRACSAHCAHCCTFAATRSARACTSPDSASTNAGPASSRCS